MAPKRRAAPCSGTVLALAELALSGCGAANQMRRSVAIVTLPTIIIGGSTGSGLASDVMARRTIKRWLAGGPGTAAQP